MAVSLSRNLKLRIDSNLTANAKYNLERIDTLGGAFLYDLSEDIIVRSKSNIQFRPDDPAVGGTGEGGTVSFGSADQPLDVINFYGASLTLGEQISIVDTASGGTKNLNFKYKSDISGSVDNAADRTLQIDLNGADRQLVLGGNFSVLSSNLSITAPIATAWILPSTSGSNGQVLSTDGSGTLSWITSAGSGTVTSVGLSAPAEFTVSGSPVTAAGTLTLTKANQAVNLVYAGPSAGDVAQPSFRALVAADVNVISGFRAMSDTWTSGTSKTVTHNWTSRKIMVQVLDGDNNYSNIEVDSIERPNDNNVILTSSEAPSNWLVLLSEIP